MEDAKGTSDPRKTVSGLFTVLTAAGLHKGNIFGNTPGRPNCKHWPLGTWLPRSKSDTGQSVLPCHCDQTGKPHSHLWKGLASQVLGKHIFELTEKPIACQKRMLEHAHQRLSCHEGSYWPQELSLRTAGPTVTELMASCWPDVHWQKGTIR